MHNNMNMHMGGMRGGGGGMGGMRRGGMRGGMGMGPFRGRGGRGGFRGPRPMRRDRRDYISPDRPASPVEDKFLKRTRTNPSLTWAENKISRLQEARRQAQGDKAEEEELQKKILRAQRRQAKHIEKKLAKKMRMKEEKKRKRKGKVKQKVKDRRRKKIKKRKSEKSSDESEVDDKSKEDEKEKKKEKMKKESKSSKTEKSNEEKRKRKSDKCEKEKNKKEEKSRKEHKKDKSRKDKSKSEQNVSDTKHKKDKSIKEEKISDSSKTEEDKMAEENEKKTKSDDSVTKPKAKSGEQTPSISFTPDHSEGEVIKLASYPDNDGEDAETDDDNDSTPNRSDRETSKTPELPETPTSPLLSRFGPVDLKTPPIDSTPKKSIDDNSDSDPTPIIDPKNVSFSEMKSPATTPIVILKPKAIYASPKSQIKESTSKTSTTSPIKEESKSEQLPKESIENNKSIDKDDDKDDDEDEEEDEYSDEETSDEDSTDDENENDDDITNSDDDDEEDSSSTTSSVVFDENIVIKEENMSPDESTINVGEIEQLMDIEAIKLEATDDGVSVSSPDSDEYTPNWEDDLSNSSFDKLCLDIEKHKTLVQDKEKETKDQTLNNEYEEFLKVLDVTHETKNSKPESGPPVVTTKLITTERKDDLDLEIPTKSDLEKENLLDIEMITELPRTRERSNSTSSTSSNTSTSSSTSSTSTSSSAKSTESNSSGSSSSSAKKRDDPLKLLKVNQNESIRNTIIAKIMEMIPDNSEGDDKIIDPEKMKDEILKIIEAESLEKENEQEKKKVLIKLESKSKVLNNKLADTDVEDFTEKLTPTKVVQKLANSSAQPSISKDDRRSDDRRKTSSRSPPIVKRRGPRTPSPRTPERARYRSNSRTRRERDRPNSRLSSSNSRRKSLSPRPRSSRPSRSPVSRLRRYRSPTPPPRRRNTRTPPPNERWNDSTSYSDENSISYDTRPPSPPKDAPFQSFSDMSLSSSSWNSDPANPYMTNAPYNLPPEHSYIDSPRRMPLDDRIDMALGHPIQQQPPPPQFYGNYLPPDRGYNQQDYNNFNVYYPEYQNVPPPQFQPNQMNPNMFPNVFHHPPPTHAPAPMSMPPQQQILPHMQVPRPDQYQNDQMLSMHPQQNFPSKNPHVRQVGNMLEIIPSEAPDMSVPPPPLPRKEEPKPPEPAPKPSASNAEILKAEKELRKLNKMMRKEKLRLELAKLVTLAEDISLDGDIPEDIDMEQTLKPLKIHDPPEKGILRADDKEELSSKKKVMFQDGVEPGHGTSTTDDETGPSLAKAKKLKKRRMKILQKNKENMDLQQDKNIMENTNPNIEPPPSDDNLPPPPPPPGSPPPNCMQPRLKNPPPPEYLYFHLDPNANRLIVTRYVPTMQMPPRMNPDFNQQNDNIPHHHQIIPNQQQHQIPNQAIASQRPFLFDNRSQGQKLPLNPLMHMPRESLMKMSVPRLDAIPMQISSQDSIAKDINDEENALKFPHHQIPSLI